MAYLLQVLTLLFAFCSGPAFAGYAQLKPPPGWSQGVGAAVPGTAGQFAFGSAANAGTYFGSSVLTNASLSVAGNILSVPVSMRLASNAPRFAAAALFLHPGIRTAAGIAAWLGLASIVWDTASNSWLTPNTTYPKSDGKIYSYVFNFTPSSPSKDGACKQYLGTQGSAGYTGSRIGPTGRCVLFKINSDGTEATNSIDLFSRADSSCPVGWFVTPGGCVKTAPPKTLDETEFVEKLSPLKMPVTVPRELPTPTPLPVEVPVLNPDPASNPLPAPAPGAIPRPLFIPTGNPVPTADPNIWNQPGVRVNPAPSTDSPWRVDLVPENIPQNSPNPKPVEELNPSVPPVTTPIPSTELGLCDQYPGIAACAPAGDKNPTPEEVKDFCVENPTVLACQKLGDLQPEPLHTKTVPLAITQDSGWNIASASCPAPKTVILSGQSYSFGMGSICDFASGIRPLVVGFAWITAILGFIGLSRKGD